ncbi:hypothetical protein HU200_015954 [Digitaria exilis]|uniref:BHLH domain-containing protein n=1 Tax=Digitaria exilis TaxID=1010633 RepID=A0A835F900_9POAL|nr:hypothetical protein HU200_015954 [Digitaria exilis]
MDPASSSVAAELRRPPPQHHHGHLASGGTHHEAASVVTATDLGSGSRSGGGGSSRRRPRRDAPEDERSSKLASISGATAADSVRLALLPPLALRIGCDPCRVGGSADPEVKRLKQMTSSENNDKINTEAETKSGIVSKSVNKKPAPPEPPKQDYIHVRARRGQATDSHSLAERVSSYLVKSRAVIGKASVLDEIINYIQSLQRQVEFLSVKLEAVNTHMNNANVSFPSKDFGAPAPSYNTAPGLTFDPQTPREYPQALTSDWLHMQIGT